jgi:hypothetical protein
VLAGAIRPSPFVQKTSRRAAPAVVTWKSICHPATRRRTTFAPLRRRVDGQQRRQSAGAIGLGPLPESTAPSERGLGCTAGSLFSLLGVQIPCTTETNSLLSYRGNFDWKCLDSRRILLLFRAQGGSNQRFPCTIPCSQGSMMLRQNDREGLMGATGTVRRAQSRGIQTSSQPFWWRHLQNDRGHVFP